MSIFSERYREGIPNIITSRVNKDINEYIAKNKVEPVIHRAGSFVLEKAKTVIWENILVIIFIAGIIIFLSYRYMMKNRREDYNNEDIEDTYDIMQFHKRRFVRPTMNPYYPVKKQMNYALYLPDKMPHKSDGENVSYVRDDQKVLSSRDLREVGVPSQVHKYTYPNYGAYQSVGDCYGGVSNPYAKPNTLPRFRNHLGYPTDFNETTGEFISSMTGLNRHAVNTYYDILQNSNNVLRKNLNID